MSWVLISAGEPSGDHHAACLVRAIRQRRPDVEFFGFGGDALQEAGVELVAHYKDLSVVGVQEVFSKVPAFFRLARTLLREAQTRRAQLAILVDYPGFHLHLAPHLTRMAIPVVDYIAPQVWAWGWRRVHNLRQWFREVLVILPFEEPLLRRWGVNAHYVGHPLLERPLPDYPLSLPQGFSPVFAFLPGSRSQEIRRHLPRMTRLHYHLASRYPQGIFLYSLVRPSYKTLLRDLPGNVQVVEGQTASCIAAADYVVVASGTASLEAGILGRPATVLYMLSELTWFLVRRLSRVRFASLVNILLREAVYPEYIQRWPEDRVIADIVEVVDNPHRAQEIQKKLERLPKILDPSRKASQEAANRIVRLLEEPRKVVAYPFPPFPSILGDMKKGSETPDR